MKVSVIIATFNRQSDLLLTIKSFSDKVNSECEFIVFDQSTDYKAEDMKVKLDTHLDNLHISYYHSNIASVPLAWNTAAKLSSGDVIIFLDDDINFECDIVQAHLSYYELNPSIVGVAGGYYTGTYDNVWLPSLSGNSANALAGVNVSFKREFFIKNGAASSFIKSFAGFDWELAEFVKLSGERLVVGDKTLVFHRAPLNGGCGNQGNRGIKWYYGCYHNHFLWMLHRKMPYKITRLPRHFYWLYKYCLPDLSLFFSVEFFKFAILKAIINAYKSYKLDGCERKSIPLESKFYRKIN